MWLQLYGGENRSPCYHLKRNYGLFYEYSKTIWTLSVSVYEKNWLCQWFVEQISQTLKPGQITIKVHQSNAIQPKQRYVWWFLYSIYYKLQCKLLGPIFWYSLIDYSDSVQLTNGHWYSLNILGVLIKQTKLSFQLGRLTPLFLKPP